jgi:hypothetical protein
MGMATPEGEVLSMICEYLALKRYFFWRQNTAPTFDWKTRQFRSMPKHAMKGIPDIIVIRDGRFIGIEVKGPKGKLSPDQAEFGRLCMRNGAEYIVARSNPRIAPNNPSNIGEIVPNR